MTLGSARAYIAAGASLIAVGAVVTNPVAPPLPDVHLPTARTVEVNLTAFPGRRRSPKHRGHSGARQAEDALAHLVGLLSDLGLTPKASKTRIVHLAEDGEGLDFLGFHHRWVRSQGRSGVKGIGFLARWLYASAS
jgi:hypothetical protein